MATYDLEEQEKLDEFKAWWKRWGALLMFGAAVLVAAAAGWQWWQVKQQTHRVEAAAAYEKLALALQGNNPKTARDVATALTQTYADTGFAARGALLVAKLDVLENKPKEAIKRLEWVTANTTEPVLRDLARLRLAGLLLDEKNYAAAMKQLDAPYEDAFKARFLDLKGDVLLAQRKVADANKAYTAAFDAMDKTNPYRAMVEIKKDSTR
jgi:predicted negative regulator of RcsB-dependent stress response